MRKTGKKFAAARQQVPDKPHSIEDAVPLMQKVKFAKFDETVEIAMRLGVDPKHADQMVRGTVVLPHGLGKTKRVLAIAGAEKQKDALKRGTTVRLPSVPVIYRHYPAARGGWNSALRDAGSPP